MRTVLALAAICVALASVPATAQKSKTPKKAPAAAKTAALKTTNDSVSYAIGTVVGNNLKQQEIELNVDLLTQGMSDVLADKNTALTMEQVQTILEAFKERMVQGQIAKNRELAAANKRAGEAFLAENKNRPGVVTLPSGLQYEIITEGTGAKPKATDKVTTHYKGTLLNGTTFDSSYDRGEPASFQLDQVIQGWTEALQLMSTGSKWRLFVPSDLAYGEGGAQGKIEPNSTLIFEVELLQVN